MKKLILITVCAFGLAMAGSAATVASAKKEPVKKEVSAPTKHVKKGKKTHAKVESTSVKPAKK
ncbi:MAG: hypothetical protein ACM3P1_11160 [Candidatus Saccharibacteria bacterium]